MISDYRKNLKKYNLIEYIKNKLNHENKIALVYNFNYLVFLITILKI